VGTVGVESLGVYGVGPLGWYGAGVLFGTGRGGGPGGIPLSPVKHLVAKSL
jgi:hypothetical protein